MISKRLGLLLIAVFSATAQTWTGSGSTGADGAFVLTATDPRVVNGIFIFDPVRDNLDVNGTNIYNFTQITIPYNVTVQIRANKLRTPGPIVWLSSGPVIDRGTCERERKQRSRLTVSLSVRAPSEPGPGGFPGGAGAKPGDVPQPGFGPGGGIAPAGTGSGGCSAGFATAYTSAALRANLDLRSLLGRRLRATATATCNHSSGVRAAAADIRLQRRQYGPGGGAGGGAIRITSDVSITCSKRHSGCVGGCPIYANGGNPALDAVGGLQIRQQIIGGAGSGGSIHLQARRSSRQRGSTCHCQWGQRRQRLRRRRVWVCGPDPDRHERPSVALTTRLSAPPPWSAPRQRPPAHQPTHRNRSLHRRDSRPHPAVRRLHRPRRLRQQHGQHPHRHQHHQHPQHHHQPLHLDRTRHRRLHRPGHPHQRTGSANITLPQGVSRFVVRATW